MKPCELYNRVPESENSEICSLIGCYYNHIPQLDDSFSWSLPADDPNKRVIIKCYKNFAFDFRRFWRLASVWFDEKPVMIIQNAGREGDDHSARFVTDAETYRAMVSYLASLANVQFEKINVVPLDVDINGLTEFYGNSLDGYFERH